VVVEELADAPAKKILTAGQKKRRSAEAKGKRLERAICAWLENQGYFVETAPRVVFWLWVAAAGRRLPRSIRRDFFTVWDGMAVKGSERWFYQVTTLGEVSRKRDKIERSGFPATPADAIFGYVGRPRKWRKLVGPDFAMPGETFLIEKE